MLEKVEPLYTLLVAFSRIIEKVVFNKSFTHGKKFNWATERMRNDPSFKELMCTNHIKL